MNENRRQFPRHEVDITARIDSEAKLNDPGVTRDVSLGGACIVTNSPFEVGERIAVTLRAGRPQPGGFRPVVGSVTRSTPLDEENYLWRHELAVRFEQPLDELTTLLL